MVPLHPLSLGSSSVVRMKSWHLPFHLMFGKKQTRICFKMVKLPRESCTEGWEFVWVWWLSGELINNACSSGWKCCSVHGLINHTLRIRFCSFNSLCSWKHKVIDTNAECAPSYVFHKRDKWTDLDQTLPFCKCSLPNSTAAWANISRHCWSQNLLNYLNTMYCHLFRLRLTGPSIIS